MLAPVLGQRFLGELCAMNVCMSVFAVTEPTFGERKAIHYIVTGKKHTKIFLSSSEVPPCAVNLITLNTLFFTKCVKGS